MPSSGNSSVMEFIPTTLGTALIEGYDGMGLATSLGKPFLRKEMEAKMKEICAGTKGRREVVQEVLEGYREVYVRAVAQVGVLRAVSGILLCFAISLRWRLCRSISIVDEVRVEGLILETGRRVRNTFSTTETARTDEETKVIPAGEMNDVP